MYADIWSSTRFDTVDTYLQYQKNHSKIKGHYYEELSGIHSEDFLRFIFEIKSRTVRGRARVGECLVVYGCCVRMNKCGGMYFLQSALSYRALSVENFLHFANRAIA